jgi:hypothetical protein
MSVFTDTQPSLDNYWRAVILFGQNVATYKFALGQALLEVASREQAFVSLEELAEPFSRHLIEHLKTGRKQITSKSSTFLDTCRKFLDESITKDQLVEQTVRLGFNNVIDAFHVVNRAEVPVRFYTDDRKTERKGITICDELFQLKEGSQASNLPHETEARWRLVETAWDLNIAPKLVVVGYDSTVESLFAMDRSLRRVDITSCRTALNGYQKGKCFYCFSDINVGDGICTADVDHFFPHVLKQANVLFGIDGVWNLVLACRDCNRGAGGKSARVPSLRFLERLHQRNEFLIESHHPLRETLMGQTGASWDTRRRFLQRAYAEAKQRLIHDWQPSFENPAAY